MNLAELLADVRDPYVGLLRATIRSEKTQRFGFLMKKQRVAAEVIVAIDDGTNPHGSRFNLPLRVDLMLQKPKAESPDITRVISAEEHQLAPAWAVGDMQFISGFPSGLQFCVYPFWWDRCDISCNGEIASWQPCLDWFRRWFDSEEKQPADQDGLHGVVHEMSEPVVHDGLTTFRVDFGSAPIDSLLDLLEVLHAMNVAELKVSTIVAPLC